MVVVNIFRSNLKWDYSITMMFLFIQWLTKEIYLSVATKQCWYFLAIYSQLQNSDQNKKDNTVLHPNETNQLVFVYSRFIILSVVSGLALVYSAAVILLPSTRETILKRRFRFGTPNGVEALVRKTQVCGTHFHKIIVFIKIPWSSLTALESFTYFYGVAKIDTA